MEKRYDAIIVGARCAGSPTAMLLARMGYRVLVVDRARFPSDTLSTHVVQPKGVAALARWGLLERLVATGCPPVHTYTFDFGPITISGAPGTAESPLAYCPRRTILDQLLVHAAVEAGAEVREDFTVEELLWEGGRVCGIRGHAKGGATVTERATVVIGADGRNSLVAQAVRPAQYNEKPPLLAAYYTYWSGLPMDGRFETYIRPNRGFAAIDTHDGLTMVVAGWPHAEFEHNKKDVEASYLQTLALAPAFTERLRGARRETASPARSCRTSCASPTDRAGRWSATPATTRTRSPRRGSATPSATPSSARPRWTRPSAEPGPSTWPWPSTRPRATAARCPCTSSPARSPRCNLRLPRCSSCSGRSWATRRPWMGS
jgi:2-polyprenyl-6-methoxyphenol hydroxylase-like FAD-dependent oxidoreductase